MKLIRLFCYFACLFPLMNGTVKAQSRTGSSAVLVTPQASLTRIGVEALASGGASVTERGLVTSAFTNPAAMEFKSLTAYAEAGKYTTSKWAGDFDYNGQFVAPAVVSLGMPLGDINISLSYFRQYDNRMSSDPIPVTTPTFPDGTGEFVRFERNVGLHSLCGTASLALSDPVSVGVTLGGNYFTYKEELSDISVTGTDKGLFIAGGVVVTLNDDVTVGASARYNQPLRFVPEMNSPRFDPGPIDTSRIRVVALETPSVEVRFPPIVEVGASWQAASWFRVLASAEFQNWTTALSYMENRWQVHVGAVAQVHEILALRFGFFTQSSPSIYNRPVLDQQFITFGIRLNAEPICLSIAAMDSHVFKKSLSSAELWLYPTPFSQTYFSSGVSVAF